MRSLRLSKVPSAYIVLAATCAGVFNAALDQTTVVAALPEIMVDLRLTVSDLDRVSWIVTGYLLGYTVAMPLMGRLSDVYGRRRLYLGALVVFSLGTCLVAMAPNLPWLVASRVVMAVGGGAVVPVTIALTGDLLPPRQRLLALGLVGAAAEMGAVLGPAWGGAVSHFLDWRWIFWLNIPTSLMVAVLLLRVLPSGPVSRSPVDYRGGFLLGLALAVVTVALSRWAEAPWWAAGGLAAGGVLLVVFLWSQQRSPHPLIPLSLFRLPSFSGANATHLLVGAALIIALVNIPLLTVTVMGQPALEGAFRLMRLTAAIPVGAVLGGILAARLGYRLPTILGLLMAAMAFYLMSRWGLDVQDPIMTVQLALCGLGFGLVIAPITAAAVNSVPEGDRGAAAALVTVMRMLGMTLGLAAITSVGTSHFNLLVGGIDLSILNPDYIQEVNRAGMTVFGEFFLAAMGLCLTSILPCFLMRDRPD